MWLYSQVKTLGDISRYHARQNPDRTALIGNCRRLTYGDIDRRSNSVTNFFIEKGLGTGSSVAFIGKNSVEYFEIFFGAAKAGMAIVPINWRLAVPEVEAILLDSRPSLIFVDREFEHLVRDLGNVTGSLEIKFFNPNDPSECDLSAIISAHDPVDPGIAVDAWSTASLMYTSGTTGKPKGVQLSHNGYLGLRLIEHLDPGFTYFPDDVVLMVMPLFHAMGSTLSFLALYCGSAMVVEHMPPPGELIALIERERPTVLPFVPTVVQMVIDDPAAADADFSSVRLNIYGGSPIAEDVLLRAISTLKCEFIQHYGGTEMGGACTILRADEHQMNDPNLLRSCGRPFPLVEVRIADPEGNELPPGVVGEILVKTPAMMTGYFGQPELTAQALRDGWYWTGDGAYRDEEGYIYVVDRIKDMIISGGENVYSVEVEQVLMRLDGVTRCAVVGMPDPKWGEAVVAALVVEPTFSLTADDIVAHCRNSIAGFKVPRRIHFLDALPLTSVGKVRKSVLKAQLAEIISAFDGSKPGFSASVMAD